MSEKISPNQVSAELRRIAMAIENSENPSLSLVSKDITSIIEKLQGSNKIQVAGGKIARYMLKVAEEIGELDINQWDTNEGEDVENKYEHAHKFNEGDKLETAVKMLKRSVDRFLKDIMEPSDPSDDSEVVTSAP